MNHKVPDYAVMKRTMPNDKSVRVQERLVGSHSEKEDELERVVSMTKKWMKANLSTSIPPPSILPLSDSDESCSFGTIQSSPESRKRETIISSSSVSWAPDVVRAVHCRPRLSDEEKIEIFYNSSDYRRFREERYIEQLQEVIVMVKRIRGEYRQARLRLKKRRRFPRRVSPFLRWDFS